MVQPLGVVDHADHRPIVCRLCQQPQHAETHQEAVRRWPGDQTERHADGVALRPGQSVESVEQRPAELMYPGERQLHVSLHADDPRDPAV